MLWHNKKHNILKLVYNIIKKKKKLIRDCNGLMYELACKFKNVVKLLFFVVFLALLEK